MDSITCPYCECKVKMSDVDDEGGVCPECGAMITGSLLFHDEAEPGQELADDVEGGADDLALDDDLDDE